MATEGIRVSLLQDFDPVKLLMVQYVVLPATLIHLSELKKNERTWDVVGFLGGIGGENEEWMWSKYFVHLEILKE